MADFAQAVALTLKHEGGFVNNPNDAGGATNMGIEQRDVPDIPIQTLTEEQAVAYYQEHYWKPLYSQINGQDVAAKLFDMGVLLGVGTAVKLLQSMLDVNADGIFGPNTLGAINSFDEVLLLAWYKRRLRWHFGSIVRLHPQDVEFLGGWLNRVNS